MLPAATLPSMALVAGVLLWAGCGVDRMEHARALNALAAERAARAEEIDRRVEAERSLAACGGPGDAVAAPGARPTLEALEREIELLRRRVEELRIRLGEPPAPAPVPMTGTAPPTAPGVPGPPAKGKP